ncbi:MAG: hypothetical protein JWM21_1791 [Acidobacteria bacterium]|nr:hypothetical protein [Acidobacteriota bacterium]
MITSRRSFLKHGSLLALAVGIPAGLTRTVLAGTFVSPPSALDLTMANFVAQLNTTFQIGQGSSKVALKLIEVANLGPKLTSGGREAFLLAFRGNNATPLKQDVYHIEHEKLGRFSLLVVPVVSRDKSAGAYEVIINRLH